jgi:FAD/FMN-containing dehydrogenase
MSLYTDAVGLLVVELDHLEWIVGGHLLKRLSRDYAWFSPVLARELDGKIADAAVCPQTEDEIRSVVAACARRDIPLTVRGSGTGNYGQSTPLHGGIVLDLSLYKQFLWQKNGVVRAQAGIRLGDLETTVRQDGWEMRWLPSTYRIATLGGLFSGGFGGVGSINHGPVASTGNVLGIKIMTIEAEPKIIELRAPEALTLNHFYGTNGIVLELEVALAPAHAWLENVVVFDSFDRALDFADTLANSPGVTKRAVTFLANPVPAYLKTLQAHLTPDCHAVLTIVAEQSEPALLQLIGESGGRRCYRADQAEVLATNRTLIECMWNHTTLHALKIDKTLTYIQSSFQPGEHLRQVRELELLLAGEVLTHLEFIRLRNGRMTCNGLQLIRYTTEARLNELMQIFRDHGVSIANPHVFIVEDGKQGKVDPAAVAAKQKFDPKGLLNPGKMRGWDAFSASGESIEATESILPVTPATP